MRFFLHIAYDGYHYRGWQKHPGVKSIQQVLETLLSKLLKEPISEIGCGRTDAEVHASQFFFHMDVSKPWNFDLLFRLNKALPDDIAIFDILPMESKAHARFDAFQRKYDYFIHTYKDPFLNRYSSLYLTSSLDFHKMSKAVRLLPKYQDYRFFCKGPLKYGHTICQVSSALLFSNHDGSRLLFQISSNRFLTGMIRIIVANLLAIGTDRLSLEEFESYFQNTDGSTIPSSLKPAYPEGLFLSKVSYPYLDLMPRVNCASASNALATESWIKI